MAGHSNRYTDISVCDFIICNMKKKINTFIDDLYKQKGKLIMRKKEISMIILANKKKEPSTSMSAKKKKIVRKKGW